MLRPFLAVSVALLCCAAPAPAPAPAPPPAPVERAADRGGCHSDTECPSGQVCESCGGPGSCTPGCHQSAQCAAGETCRQVQCIRCPCPGRCGH